MNAVKKAIKDYAKEVDNEEFVVAQEKLLENINKNTIPKDVLREICKLKSNVVKVKLQELLGSEGGKSG